MASNVCEKVKVIQAYSKDFIRKVADVTGWFLSFLSTLVVKRLLYVRIAFLAHMSTECSVSYCGHSPSVRVRPSHVHPTSVHNLLVNTLASTNINQSSPNLVKMYMTTRARMSSIMELIGPELPKLSALELENLPYLTMFTL